MPRISKSATQERRTREKARRLEEFAGIGEELFLRKGYPNTTTDDLAQAMGVSVGTFYNLFANKDVLYAAIVRRIIDTLLRSVENILAADTSTDVMVEDVIRLRIVNFDRHRLFFQLFSGENACGVYPNPKQLSPDLPPLLQRYLRCVADIFKRGMEAGMFVPAESMHLAIGLDGAITAFMSYWEHPADDTSVEAVVRSIRDTFFARSGLYRTDAEAEGGQPPVREVYLNRFDTERLRELISVARWFGKEENQPHLHILENALQRGRTVEPCLVPDDVVTMNTRVELRDTKDGSLSVRTLVFPVDARDNEDSASILEPLGTALFGSRVGDVIAHGEGADRREYRVVRMLYQPESAGDFHR